MTIWVMLKTLSQPPNVKRPFTRDIEYGTDDTGDVPSPAFVEKATPSDAMKSPVTKRRYPVLMFLVLSLVSN